MYSVYTWATTGLIYGFPTLFLVAGLYNMSQSPGGSHVLVASYTGISISCIHFGWGHHHGGIGNGFTVLDLVPGPYNMSQSPNRTLVLVVASWPVRMSSVHMSVNHSFGKLVVASLWELQYGVTL